MSISIDQNKLGDLRKLSAFFEFISNPQAYKDFLAETRATLANMDAIVKAHASVETAEEYLKAAAAKIGEVNEYVAAGEKKVAAAQALEETRQAKVLELEARRNAELEQKAVALETQRVAQEQLQTELAVASAAQAAREQALSAREQNLAAQEQTLMEKKAKLNQLLG